MSLPLEGKGRFTFRLPKKAALTQVSLFAIHAPIESYTIQAVLV